MSKFERLPDMACKVTPELKKRIDDVNQDAIALHLAVFPTVYVGTKISDFDGNVVSDDTYKANSFNRNFYNYILGVLYGAVGSDTSTFGAGHINVKAFGGIITVPTVATAIYGFGATSSGMAIQSSSSVQGIVCGSGTAAEAFDGYNLTTISDGTTTGKLSYMNGVITEKTYHSDTKKWDIIFTRIFKNVSGGTITVSEVGLLGTFGSSTCMYERTLFPEAKVVLNNQQLEVTYKFEFTFPEPAV